MFDPYRKWFGIPAKDQPPNHYRLLSLELFENDLHVIEGAAERQISFVKQYQTGEHAADAQRLLGELEDARQCLVSGASKSEYDEILRTALSVEDRLDGDVGTSPLIIASQDTDVRSFVGSRLVVSPASTEICDVVLPQEGILRVGRNSECEIRLDDPSVSRVHAEFRCVGGRIWLKDLNSRFGTLVNGIRTDECEIRQGDLVHVGETTIRFPHPHYDPKATVPPNNLFTGQAEDFPKVSQATPQIFEEISDAAYSSNNRAPQTDVVSPQTPPRYAPRELVGRRFGRFKVIKLISQSQRSAMLQAIDENLDSVVALKIFSLESIGASAVVRLQRAVETTMELAHPHLIKLYASGCDERLNWIASEFIEGENASQLIKRIGIAGMLDWRQTLKAAIHVAKALDFIETKQIVHRNISPTSILFRNSDGIVKLGDLILAKVIDDDAIARLTQAGEIIGDLPYCSPEQLSGKTTDSRSDQYNLGATLYALLTGHPPCEGRTLAETIAKVTSEPPVPPARYHLAVPALFSGVVLRMLAKRPVDRYSNSLVLLRELQRVALYLGETESAS